MHEAAASDGRGQSLRALVDPHLPPHIHAQLAEPTEEHIHNPFVFNLRRPTMDEQHAHSHEHGHEHEQVEGRGAHQSLPASTERYLQVPGENYCHPSSHPSHTPREAVPISYPIPRSHRSDSNTSHTSSHTRIQTNAQPQPQTVRSQQAYDPNEQEILNADPWRDYDSPISPRASSFGARSQGSALRNRLRHSVSRMSREEARETAQDAGEAPPRDFQDLVQIYTVVSDRRSSFDNLLWQVPTMGLTAHAFLFSIALASDTSKAARIISSALSILITFMTLHLFTRQLQAEDADNRWLEDFEKRHHLNEIDCAHGAAWSKYRSQLPTRARHFKHLAKLRGFTVWSNGLLAIGATGILVMILSIFNHSVLIGCSCGGGSGGSGSGGVSHFTCPYKH
ncbi:hypothetical protein BT69DRAFT_641096 [Atractiella rhizophila]|nr:hypothetical protein BT69DRAFT_641096 [Atractiella rhizophila]